MHDLDPAAVKSLLANHIEFKRLYDKHTQLNQQVDAVQRGVESMEDLELEMLKKEKLMLKDKMAHMVEDYRRLNFQAA
ncbi:MAG: YdcH family protein [Gammaproteobacteria bacterium]